ncbi:hypothetical protein [Streptomyces sp. NPDC046821]|uniref:hypothetical protein n=1 Tax=Streptomyces sp. NPDC046821 TaxID=3154702 RepID=UPI0034005113
MRTTRAPAVSAAAAAAVGLAAPAASAWSDSSNIVAMPSVIARGGQLTVTVDGTSCRTRGSTVSSRAFPTTPLRRASGDTSVARPIINRDAEPGSNDTVHCGEGPTLTRPAAFTVIRGGVRGGPGGSTGTGAGKADMAIGGGMVGAAVVGGGVFGLRRRAENKF